MIKKILFRGVGMFLLIAALYVIVVVAQGTVTDYQPPAEEPLAVQGTPELSVITDSIFSLLTWNLGYAGLGEESSFFYDTGNMFLGGSQPVRPKKEVVEKNVNGIKQLLGSVQSDFVLLQEVDQASKRSYFIDQQEIIASLFANKGTTFAVNYKVDRVPIPILEPWRAYGTVYAGISTFFPTQPISEPLRLQLPGAFDWPTRIFQLDRCVAMHRFAMANGKELVVINLHLSAYDANGELKVQQMSFLKDLVLAEYEKGNYVIAGGDWNLCPPFFRIDGFMPGGSEEYSQTNIAPDLLPANWRWVYDPTIPTSRKTSTPYQAGKTFITIIDFYLISPNLKVREVKTLDQQFRFSDHQPVWMEVEIR